MKDKKIDERTKTERILQACLMEDVPKVSYQNTSHIAEALNQMMTSLDRREMRIIELRLGLCNGPALSWSKVGLEFKVSGTRIRQIYLRIWQKMRHPSRLVYLKEFLK